MTEPQAVKVTYVDPAGTPQYTIVGELHTLSLTMPATRAAAEALGEVWLAERQAREGGNVGGKDR